METKCRAPALISNLEVVLGIERLFSGYGQEESESAGTCYMDVAPGGLLNPLDEIGVCHASV